VKKIILCFAIIIFSIVDSSRSFALFSVNEYSSVSEEPQAPSPPPLPPSKTNDENPGFKGKKTPPPKIDVSLEPKEKGLFSTAEGELEIAFYNVENLFDVKHDVGKNDWEFLPKDYPGKKEACQFIKSDYFREKCINSNWTEEKLNLKLSQIKDLFTRERDHLPEILGLCEIENKNVLRKLAKVLGYKRYIVTDSLDKRGIDVAILFNPSSKLKFVRSKEHQIEGNHFISMPTRSILEVEFDVGKGQRLITYINHWPSQRNPSQTRLIASRNLKKLILKKIKKRPETRVIAMGDFNTIAKDFPRPIRGVLTETVEPSMAGESLLVDIHKVFLRTGPKALKNLISRGTYFYVKNMEWNQLDRFLMSSNFFSKGGLEVDVDTYTVYAPGFSAKAFKYDDPDFWTYGSIVSGVPKKYNFETTDSEEAGYSDHFPIFVKVRF
tara:strand:+ start:411 stop:1724 length:1314 start_codon:yes stop_codon:yes gene_type:complete